MAARFKWSRLAGVGLVLFLAGGISNLVDRIAMGSVIDFLNIGIGPVRTGIFNVADVAIMARHRRLLLIDTGAGAAPVGNAFPSYTPSWAESSSPIGPHLNSVQVYSLNRLAFDMHYRCR